MSEDNRLPLATDSTTPASIRITTRTDSNPSYVYTCELIWALKIPSWITLKDNKEPTILMNGRQIKRRKHKAGGGVKNDSGYESALLIAGARQVALQQVLREMPTPSCKVLIT